MRTVGVSFYTQFFQLITRMVSKIPGGTSVAERLADAGWPTIVESKRRGIPLAQVDARDPRPQPSYGAADGGGRGSGADGVRWVYGAGRWLRGEQRFLDRQESLHRQGLPASPDELHDLPQRVDGQRYPAHRLPRQRAGCAEDPRHAARLHPGRREHRRASVISHPYEGPSQRPRTREFGRFGDPRVDPGREGRHPDTW